jgi:uncharacterized protein (TIGR02996 family)
MARFQLGSEIRDVVLDGSDSEARLRYSEAQRALFHAGYVRVRDPAREPEFRDDEPRDAELERALHENPDDDQTWLVYADHYIQHGHARGPLIAIESAPVKNVVHRAEREAQARRIRREGPDLLDGITVKSGLDVRWKRGFLHRVRLHGAYERGECEDLLFTVLRHPSARFLRELELDAYHRTAQDHRLLLDVLLHHVPPPPLRVLRIEYPAMEWTGFPPLGALGELGNVFPQLEHLHLESDDTTSLAGLAVPRAKKLTFITSNVLRHTMRAIAEAPWPELEELTLRFGSASPCKIDDVRFIFTLPKLRVLRLEALELANAFVEELVHSPLAKQLEVLDLHYSALDDRGAHVLAQSRGAFPADFRCYVERTRITDTGLNLLEAAGLMPDWW